MKSRHSRLYVALLSAVAALPVVVQAQSSAVGGLNTAEKPRVTQAVDSNVVFVVHNSHLALLGQKVPLGSVPDSTPMNHMQLILKRSALRQSALDGLIAALHDPHSSSFHQWVTPQEFGANFGVAEADIAATTSWLVSQGFTVHGVYPNKMQIDFSGSAGQVKRAFHTQENRYTIKNATHIANGSDISLPTALKEVVAGVAGLSDVHPEALYMPPELTRFNPATHRFTRVDAPNPAPKPMAINVNGVRGLVPYDLATMYGVNKIRQEGITGKGITIALLENADMVAADWPQFVAQFDLGSYGGTFAQIQPQAPGFPNCVDPTLFPYGESFETILDAEWSTAIAPGAHIEVASCADSNSTNFFGGVMTAGTNLINGATRPDIISVSYGWGELQIDSAIKTAIDLMWAQADAEGISVFVASGDSGSDPSFNGGIIEGYGLDANFLATSPNDTAVGGTDTGDILEGTTNTYFSPKMNPVYGTALSYVPEIAWNQSCGNSIAARSIGYSSALAFCKAYLKTDPNGYDVTSLAGSGGPSSVDIKPAWQRQVWGAARDQSRDTPDVSIFGYSYGKYTQVVICTSYYPCTPGFPEPVFMSGGTSLASPLFAGIQALIDQGVVSRGLKADQGNAAPTLYALAAQEYGGATGTPPASLAACNANNGTIGTSGCVFHNVTSGGNSTQCIQQLPSEATPDCYFYGTIADLYYPQVGFVGPAQVGLTSTTSILYTNQKSAYPAQPGWSFATGLGSVNATNLLSAWEKFVDPH
jgi:subtilase family serine protease